MTSSNTVSSPVDSLLRILVLTVLYVLPAGVALLPTVDPDIWWHLRIGEWIVAHRTVPTTDPFSQYGIQSGTAWQAYSWLFEVLVYGLYSLGGMQGVFLGRCLLTLALIAALHCFLVKRPPLGRESFLLTALVMGAAILALLPLLSERPWLFTILFSLVTLDVVLDVRAGRRSWAFWLLPLLYVLWANIHIQVIYGLFLLGLATIAPLIDRFRLAQGEEDAAARSWLPLGVLTAACTLATLATPYHVHLYEVVGIHASQREPLQQVAEMKAMGFRDPYDWCVLGLAGLAVFTLGRRQRISAFEVLFLIAAAWFAFRARRDVWFLVLASLAALAPTPGRQVAPVFLPRLREALVAAGLVLAFLTIYWVRFTTGPGFDKTLASEYPVGAVAFVEEEKLSGPLFNHYDWGGYLMWALPHMPVGMDGRANLHGDERMARAAATWRGQGEWQDDPELRVAEVVIAEARMPLTALLRTQPRFRVAYEDEVAVVFVRTTRE